MRIYKCIIVEFNFNSILYCSDNNTHNRNKTEDEKITASPYRSKFIAYQAKYMKLYKII